MSILPIFYFGSIEYYVFIAKSSQITFEIYEHFPKQTYRNRMSIYGANGLLNLSIPIHHSGERVPVKDIKISNSTNWQTLHWRSLESAYRSSPYFEYYESNIFPFYYNHFENLVDFNILIHKEICNIIGLNNNFTFTKSYSKLSDYDLRNHFNSKKKNQKQDDIRRYIQVFGNKYGFIANLSILDLLFNLGPETKAYLLLN